MRVDELAALLLDVGEMLQHGMDYQIEAKQLAKFRGALMLAKEAHGEGGKRSGCKIGGFPSTLLLDEFFHGYSRLSVRCETCGFMVTYEENEAFAKGWPYDSEGNVKERDG